MVDLNPLVFSVETGEAMYPFEVPEIYDFMWEMNSIYHDGLLRGNFLEEGSDYYLEDNVLETGKFSIYIGMVSEIYDNSNYEILEAPFYLGGRYGSSLGIYSESENSQDALNFIYLSRTNSDLANALVYGEEGKDYQMLDGVASDMNGEEIYPYYNETILGIYDKAAASSSDRTQNIDKRQYRDVMMTKAKDSGITGFALDEEISEDAYWEIKALGEDEYFVGLISAPDKNHYEEIFEDMEACSEEAVAYKNKVNEDIENYRK
jgi:hypothetical protein